MLNKTQNFILSQFLRNSTLRYSDAVIKGLGHDLFNYHLRFLLEKEYITKDRKNYYLTNLGKKYVQHLDIKGNFKQYFKVSVLVYLLDTKSTPKKILLHKRLRHPYYGDIATISGKVLQGEKVQDAGRRKLLEETGLICEELKHIGIHRKIRLHNKEVFEDTFYQILVGSHYTGELISQSEHGENFWDTFDKAIKYQSENKTRSKGSVEVIERLFQNNLSWFYWEEEINLDNI